MGLIRRLYNPGIFQGVGKKRRYFEGWYLKMVSADGSSILSVIPGFSADSAGERHAFIQVIDGVSCETRYTRFDASEFSAGSRDFDVRIGANRFSAQGLSLNLDLPGCGLHGQVSFGPLAGYRGGLLSPGVMGPFAFLPGMECNHGMLSMDHTLTGSLVFCGQKHDFTGGRGYMEKDWGCSFPRSWLWMQSNHFGQPGVSLMLSLARIPYLGFVFPGFLCVYRRPDGIIERFATYTGARIEGLALKENSVRLWLVQGQKVLEIVAERDGAGLLQAPVAGRMDRRIAESVNARIHLKVTEKGRVIFEDTGRHAGLEVVGTPSDLGSHGGSEYGGY